jgi:uncharacterized protein
MRKLFMFVVGLSLVIQLSVAQDAIDPALEQKIRELLELTDASAMATQGMQQMVDYFKTSFADVPDEFWDRVMTEAEAGSLIELILPIYAKYYSLEDVEQLIAFYQTPLGQKMLQVQGPIAQESMTAGAQWGEELGMRVMQQLEEEGYEPNQ